MRASPSTLRSWALAVGRSAEAAGTPWTPPTSTAVRLGAARRGAHSIRSAGSTASGGSTSNSGSSNNCASLHTASNRISSASLASTTARPSLLRTAPIPATTPQVLSPHRRLLSTHTPTLLSAPSNPEEPNVYSRPDAEGEAVVDDSAPASASSYSPSVLLTDRAIKHLQKVAKREGAEKAKRMALRIAVEPGGCHGYQYKMELVDAEEGRDEVGEADDFRFLPSAPSPETDATEPICILIDSISLTLLRGSTIDYVTELIGSQFAIKDNPQAKGAGCGCGVSWEPKV
ncbi:unnamed protein product [Jaminaea pallidilutea]